MIFPFTSHSAKHEPLMTQAFDAVGDVHGMRATLEALLE
jgi:hypothetical protein